MNFTYFYVIALCLYAVGVGSVIAANGLTSPQDKPLVPKPAPGMSQGAYLAKMGDCISCHSAANGPPYAGGLAINAPFGIIYSTNITPDKDYGIGNDTLEDFSNALRKGIAKDGHRLYPAMPYASFAGASDEDIAALYAFFMQEVRPVHVKPQQTKLAFPFTQRWGLWFWDVAFADGDHYQPRDDREAMWNRGAYLAQSFAHCGECHSPRGLAYEQKGTHLGSAYASGGLLDNWYAVNLREDKASGLERWSKEDIASFLKTGHGAGAAAFGNMTQVVENSTQYLTDEDADAIAYYIKSLSPHGEEASYLPQATHTPLQMNEHPGAGLYASSCAGCHGSEGSGKALQYPALAGNPAIMADNAASLTRLTLEGGKSAKTIHGPKPEAMPGFATKFTDSEIADVLNYIRQSWGNHAPTVSVRDVATVRNNIKQ